MAYPQLLRFDPLAVRISETSLMISNVVFSAECVVGLAFTGFRIYASSVGNPIYEEEVKITANTARNTAKNIIASKAGLWLTGLQSSVVNVNNATVRQTSIKDSIDRAGWQQHFDLVGNSYSFNQINWGSYHVDDSGTIEGTMNNTKSSIDRVGWQTHIDLVGSAYTFDYISSQWINHYVDDSGNIQEAILNIQV